MPKGNLVVLTPEDTVLARGVATVKGATKLVLDHAKTAGKEGTYQVLIPKQEIDSSTFLADDEDEKPVKAAKAKTKALKEAVEKVEEVTEAKAEPKAKKTSEKFFS